MTKSHAGRGALGGVTLCERSEPDGASGLAHGGDDEAHDHAVPSVAPQRGYARAQRASRGEDVVNQHDGPNAGWDCVASKADARGLHLRVAGPLELRGLDGRVSLKHVGARGRPAMCGTEVAHKADERFPEPAIVAWHDDACARDPMQSRARRGRLCGGGQDSRDRLGVARAEPLNQVMHRIRVVRGVERAEQGLHLERVSRGGLPRGRDGRRTIAGHLTPLVGDARANGRSRRVAILGDTPPSLVEPTTPVAL